MRRERRKNFRVEWHSPATIYDLERHSARPCILSDFSNGGAKITGVRASTIPDEFMLRFNHGHGGTRKCRVIWRTDDTLGIEFTDHIKRAEKPNLKQSVREPTS
jgi:PilZ domain